MQTVVRLLIHTLKQEFHDSLFPQWWEIFDIQSWLDAPPNSRTEDALWTKFNNLCRSRGWNEISSAREFSHIKAIAIQNFVARPESERATDGVSASDAVAASGRGLNRRCWAEAVLEAESSHGKLPAGRSMYAWYKANCDSTCDVERLIVVVKRHMKIKGADTEGCSLRDVTTTSRFGP